MKTSEKSIGKILLGTGMMALLSAMLIAVLALCVLNGLLPVERPELICCIVHFATVYCGSLICCGIIKEKKGICAGISTAIWYVILLFVSVVLLDSNTGNIIASVVAGLSGYGAALLSCIVPKRRSSNRRIKFRSR